MFEDFQIKYLNQETKKGIYEKLFKKGRIIGLHKKRGKNMKKIITVALFAIIVCNFCIGLNLIEESTAVSLGLNWWNENWQYRKEITINHTQVPSDLMNFPVLICCRSTDFINHAQLNGDDIVIIDGMNSHKYNHEIELYNSSTGEIIVWVNITSLSSTKDTILYMYYGNPTCENQENIQGTWDSNYFAVYHLNGVNDSTGNGLDLIEQGNITLINGKIGLCYTFDGVDDFLKKILTPPEKITIEIWFNSEIKDTYRRALCIRKDPDVASVHFEIRNTEDGYGIWFSGGTPDWEIAKVSGSDWKELAWNYAVLTAQKNDTSAIFLNGLMPVTSNEIRSHDLDSTSDMELCIGQRGGLPPHGQDSRWKGKIDEVRISKIVRNISWIQTGYINQNSPSAFFTIGNEENQFSLIFFLEIVAIIVVVLLALWLLYVFVSRKKKIKRENEALEKIFNEGKK